MNTSEHQDALSKVSPAYIHLTLEELYPIIKMKRTAIYAAIKNEDFPAPIQFGSKRSVWNMAEVLAWVDSRPRGVRPVTRKVA